MNEETKTYLGDGVYAEIMPLGIRLYTDNGVEQGAEIILEPQVLANLNKWVDRICKEDGVKR